MNQIILVGNLVKDPEVTKVKNSVTKCKFRLAVSRYVKNNPNEQGTDFFNVVTWRELADSCAQYCKKGKKVLVGGSIHIDTYTDKDGIIQQYIEVSANKVEFLSLPETSGDTKVTTTSDSPIIEQKNTLPPRPVLEPTEEKMPWE